MPVSHSTSLSVKHHEKVVYTHAPDSFLLLTLQCNCETFRIQTGMKNKVMNMSVPTTQPEKQGKIQLSTSILSTAQK